MTTEPTEQQTVLAALIETFAALEAKDDDDFANWYLQQVNYCDTDAAKIKEMAAVMTADVERRRSALVYVHGERFRELVDAKLDAQAKGKTVKFLMGTAGHKKVADKLTFIADQKAETIAWADENLETDDWIGGIKRTDPVKAQLKELSAEEFADCIDGLLVTPFKKHFAETGEIPAGVDIVPAHEGFHINNKVVDLGLMIESVRAELDVPNALLPEQAREESTDE